MYIYLHINNLSLSVINYEFSYTTYRDAPNIKDGVRYVCNKTFNQELLVVHAASCGEISTSQLQQHDLQEMYVLYWKNYTIPVLHFNRMS